jgi:predicted HD phosphohydrolase
VPTFTDHPFRIADIDELFELLERSAQDHDSPGVEGEAVDQLAHGLQCAYELLLSHPDDDELQIAGLVHDIGHQLVPGDDAGHGVAAAEAVRELLGDRVATLVELHVPAKRYLVATDPAYRSLLSSVSVRTLGNQGGTMTVDEAADLRRRDGWEDGVALRRADDRAKTPGRVVFELTWWRPVVERVVAAQRTR